MQYNEDYAEWNQTNVGFIGAPSTVSRKENSLKPHGLSHLVNIGRVGIGLNRTPISSLLPSLYPVKGRINNVRMVVSPGTGHHILQ